MKLHYAAGATPLNLNEIDGLIPIHITNQNELNEWEAANILKAENWLNSTSTQKNWLSMDFIKLLHQKMFDDTWRWAGKFRKTAKNIGVDQSTITTELKNLIDDTYYQLEKNIYPIDEIAYRFHHRLVWIHPFSNGNGRHARMMTDILLIQNGCERFSWGRQKLEKEGPVRKQYIDALKDADKQHYSALAEFVRS